MILNPPGTNAPAPLTHHRTCSHDLFSQDSGGDSSPSYVNNGIEKEAYSDDVKTCADTRHADISLAVVSEDEQLLQRTPENVVKAKVPEEPSIPTLLRALGKLGLIMAYFFLCDRLGLFTFILYSFLQVLVLLFLGDFQDY